jgi:hypothetical protein
MQNQEIKPIRIPFIQALIDAGCTDVVTRAELDDVCETTGLFVWPPAWIVKDKNRRAGRGLYNVPEVGILKGGGSTTPVVTPKKVTKQVVEPAVAVAVATVGSMDTSMNLAMGMTGGERATLVPDKFNGYVTWGHFKDAEAVVKSRQFYPIFVTGLSGNGKTLMVEQICAKLKRECYRVNITKQTDEDDLLGGFRLINGNTVWQDGPVVSAMKSGGVLLLDEVDLASHNIMCLQPVLEGKGVFLKKISQWVTPAEGFTVFATANTKGKGSDDGRFIGTGILNEAFLDRFPITMEQPYATPATEKKILVKAGCEKEFAHHLTKWAEIIRKSFYEGAVDEIISTRRLVDIVNAFGIFGDKNKAIGFCLARFDDDTKEAFLNLYSKVDADMQMGDEEDSPATASADGNVCPF